MSLEIPKRYLVSVTMNNELIATSVAFKKRVKNKVVSIKNEKNFKSRASDEIQQIKNEKMAGWRLEILKLSKSRGTTHTFYLKNDKFSAPVKIDSDRFQEIQNNCTIINGEIQDKFLYTSVGFLPESIISRRLEQEKKEKENLDSFKDRRVFKKDLVPGTLYINHKKGNSVDSYFMYFGEITLQDDAKNTTQKFQMFVNWHYWMRREFTDRPKGKNIFDFFLRYFVYDSNQYTPEYYFVEINNCPRYLGAGVRFYKTIPQLWNIPTDHEAHGINYIDALNSSEKELLFQFLARNKPELQKIGMEPEQVVSINWGKDNDKNDA